MRVGLYDQLGPIRFDKAVALGRKIAEAVDKRDERIKELGVDPKFAYPDANWNYAPNDYREAYKRLATFDWEEVRYLRIRGKNFTGFNLQRMQSDIGTSLDPINMDCDKCWPVDPPQDLLDKWNARTNGIPAHFAINAPPMLGEVGWKVMGPLGDGYLINSDVVGYQERMFLLWCSEALSADTQRILEIGGGYGALASAITSTLSIKYYICDLPECLLFSGMYLTMTTDRDVRLWPDEGGQVTLIPNYYFELIKLHGIAPLDLFINTLSFAEMTEYQVRKYVGDIKDLSHSQSKLFEQNHLNNDLPDGTHQAAVPEICASVFSNRQELTAPFSLINGFASVWS